MFECLKREMLTQKISIHQLSEKVGVTEKTLRNKINGITDFTWPEVLKIRNLVASHLHLEELFLKDEEEAL